MYFGSNFHNLYFRIAQRGVAAVYTNTQIIECIFRKQFMLIAAKLCALNVHTPGVSRSRDAHTFQLKLFCVPSSRSNTQEDATVAPHPWLGNAYVHWGKLLIRMVRTLQSNFFATRVLPGLLISGMPLCQPLLPCPLLRSAHCNRYTMRLTALTGSGRLPTLSMVWSGCLTPPVIPVQTIGKA
jgi:hypothetical protein